MARLRFFFASMNAGKSTHLLQADYNYRQGGMNTMLITSSLDDRFGVGNIQSRLGIGSKAVAIGPDDCIESAVSDFIERNGHIDCVMVDEAQFLTREQVWFLSDLVDYEGIDVYCYGLRNDFTGSAFVGSQNLMALADELVSINSVCFCGEIATMVVRTDAENNVKIEGDQVAIEEVGEKGMVRYHSVCRKHFKEAVQCSIYPHPVRPDMN